VRNPNPSDAERNFWGTYDRATAAIRRVEGSKILTEIKARKVLCLPEEGPIDLEEARKSRDINIKHFEKSLAKAAALYRGFFQACIRRNREAYELLSQGAPAAQPSSA
jgi:hypothetical protein